MHGEAVSNMGLKRFLAALLLLTLATSAWGQDYKKGMQAYEQGDYSTALREFRPLAEQGDNIAQWIIGSAPPPLSWSTLIVSKGGPNNGY
jgi:TPR repeat protein